MVDGAPVLSCAHLLISGTVQGVGYRYSMLSEATARQLSGWVRNLPDGRVEAMVEGPIVKVKALIQWCHQGPVGAQVQDVVVDYLSPQGLEGFEIRH